MEYRDIQAKSAGKGGGEAVRVLLVDDEAGFRMAVARRLGKRAMVTSQVASGRECLDFLNTTPVDVVVLDVCMPGMDGIDTLRAVKKAHELIEVILLTGNAAVADGIAGIKAGAFDYLTKPVELDHLANKIHQAVDRVRMETERRRQALYREKLEKKMVDTERLAALGTLSTGIAHEINNPLAVINEAAGYMEQVLAAPDMVKTPRREALMMALGKIESSVKRARKITHQLLGHVKKQGARMVVVDLYRLVEETLGLLKGEMKSKQVHIRWKSGKKEQHLVSDPWQIRQVLINLLANAVHALGNEGTITLSLGETGGFTVLEITDNGVGIPPEDLGKIFDPFFTTKPFDQGTGLGLFVVHRIMTGLNAEIDVKSRPGTGTTFTLKFPPEGRIHGGFI